MKATAILLIVLLACGMIVFIRGGRNFHIAEVLPGCDERDFSPSYFLGGIAMLGLLAWHLARLRREDGGDADDGDPNSVGEDDEWGPADHEEEDEQEDLDS